MNFNDLYCLLTESKKHLSRSFLSKYILYSIQRGRKNLDAVIRYLRQAQIPKQDAFVAKERDRNATSYCLFINESQSMPDELYKKIKEDLKPYIHISYGGLHVNELRDNIKWYEYESVENYDVDQETKDAWKGVIDEL